VKTFPTLIEEKKATTANGIIWSIVKLLYLQAKRPCQRGLTEYQKEERNHNETGVPASNTQELLLLAGFTKFSTIIFSIE
jgi:hypothetical protein